MKRWLIILTVFSWVLCISAQENSREKKVKGSYTYEIPKSMSYDQACQAALVKAQNDAIAEAFGLSMLEDNSLFVSNINGQSDVSFHSTSEGTVRGVWLADESEPVYEKFQENGRDWVKVTVKGRAREIRSAGIDFEIAPIRYKPDKELATDVFKNNDDFFLYFKSPVNGYLTIFLLDIAANQAYCILPYQDSGSGSYPITFGQDYYFFSPSHARPEDGTVDELVLTCAPEKPEEYNQLYIIFSPNKYGRALSKNDQQQRDDGLVIPSSLDYKDFNKWLMKCQQKDEEMEVRRIPIKIINK